MYPYLIQHHFDQAAERHPEAECVVEQDARASYRTIAEGSRAVARLLVEAGVGRHDRVALLAANGNFYVRAYLGILRAGAVVVPVNTGADERTLSLILEDSGASAVVVGQGFERKLHLALSKETPATLRTIVAESRYRPPTSLKTWDASLAEDGPFPTRPAIDLDPAAIVYTSGSTGRPRGVVLSHRNLVANTLAIVEYLRITAEDRALVVLPFYYIYGASVLHSHLFAGATLVIDNRFMYPQVVVDTLERENATSFAGVPSTYAILLDRTDYAQRRLPTLRYLTQAGGPMSPALTRRLIEASGGRSIYVMYGATEAGGRLTYVPPDELAARLGEVGRAIPNVELTVRRPDGAEAAIGEAGELVARGTSIAQGYWNCPEETAAAFDDLGYHTGDLGVRDEAGYFRIVGRSKDMIKSGAHRISPKEIEAALEEHPAIQQAAVVGVPDELLGEAIWAFLVARSVVDEQELRRFLAERLPTFKIPHVLRFETELPKNESGKIMKQSLRERTRVDPAMG